MQMGERPTSHQVLTLVDLKVLVDELTTPSQVAGVAPTLIIMMTDKTVVNILDLYIVFRSSWRWTCHQSPPTRNRHAPGD